MMNAAMVEEVAKAVITTVRTAIAPLQRQLDELLAWRKAVGELRNGVDGQKGEPGIAGKDGAAGINGKDGADGANGKDGAPGKDAPPVDLDAVVAKVLPLIPLPKDGRDGRDGADGTNGKDGLNGRDGERGEKGADGINGKDGASGIGIKRFDYEPTLNTLDIFMDNDELFTINLPKPARGEKGEPGRDGKDGAPGINGKDGADGLNGKDGAAGINGKDGANGIDGKDGSQGIRGENGEPPSAEELAAAVTKACEATLPGLIAKHVDLLIDGIVTRASLLVPPGRDGMHGRPGTPGEPGRDGASIESLSVGKRSARSHELTIRMTDGSVSTHEIKFDGMVIDADVHRPGESYEKGDAVTHGGSYWIAKADTNGTPGKSDDWRLAVKRGRDGKDAE